MRTAELEDPKKVKELFNTEEKRASHSHTDTKTKRILRTRSCSFVTYIIAT